MHIGLNWLGLGGVGVACEGDCECGRFVAVHFSFDLVSSFVGSVAFERARGEERELGCGAGVFVERAASLSVISVCGPLCGLKTSCSCIPRACSPLPLLSSFLIAIREMGKEVAVSGASFTSAGGRR
jgi:hypothetical protein